MERPESATKIPEAGRRISPARYCTSTLRPRKAEKRAILYVVSERGGNRVNSTEGPPLRIVEKPKRRRDFSLKVIDAGEAGLGSAKSLTFCEDGLLSAFRGLDSWPN